MIHKLLTLTKIIKLYKTWRLAILDRYNLLNGTTKHVLRNNVQYIFRAGVDDTGKINEIYIFRVYHEFLDHISDNSIIIDIGAHIGVFSIFAQTLAKNVTVYSYEPFDENFRLLQENIRLNNAYDRIHAFNIGISGRRGTRELFLDKTDKGRNSIRIRKNAFIQIDTISLKDVFDENRITRCDFLKMDCEGAEYEILYNTPKEYLEKIKTITMEYHTNEDINELIGFLQNNGFKVETKKDKGDFLYAKK